MRIRDWSSDVCSSDLRLRFAQIPRDARGADHRPRKAPGNRVVAAHRRDIDVALLEDTVVGDEADRILEQSRQPRVEPVADVGEQLDWRVLMHPADPDIGAVHPPARNPPAYSHAVYAPLTHHQVST